MIEMIQWNKFISQSQSVTLLLTNKVTQTWKLITTIYKTCYKSIMVQNIFRPVKYMQCWRCAQNYLAIGHQWMHHWRRIWTEVCLEINPS